MPIKETPSEKSRKKTRLVVLSMIGRGIIKCAQCGCDDILNIEINHIKGGGNKEKREFYKDSSYTFWRRIKDGTRGIDDLNLLCRACNFVSHIEQKTNNKYLIQWIGK